MLCPCLSCTVSGGGPYTLITTSHCLHVSVCNTEQLPPLQDIICMPQCQLRLNQTANDDIALKEKSCINRFIWKVHAMIPYDLNFDYSSRLNEYM